MDDVLLKLIVGLGAPGILAGVLYTIMRQFIASHAQQVTITQQAQAARIDALEKGHQQCEEERQKNANLLVDILREQSEAMKAQARGAKKPKQKTTK